MKTKSRCTRVARRVAEQRRSRHMPGRRRSPLHLSMPLRVRTCPPRARANKRRSPFQLYSHMHRSYAYNGETKTKVVSTVLTTRICEEEDEVPFDSAHITHMRGRTQGEVNFGSVNFGSAHNTPKRGRTKDEVSSGSMCR